ncbi:J domain-containing protein [Marinobacter sp. OP 3.4]|uniref:J domain-containing protein n=1 Tax=Marinobacter sp. OP 3.4 TaxID=3076501 RepID=UPI002E1DC6A0
MNCWEILGIEPTRDSTRIRDAYERQSKFAEGDEAQRLRQAYQQAMGEAGEARHTEAPEPAREPSETASPRREESSANPSSWQAEAHRGPLSATDRQVVREVVIQVNAMLNDSGRLNDVAIWRAILTEPPADQDAIRTAIGEELEPRLRPLAEEARLAAPVARFLGDWFGWYGMTDALEREAQEDELTLDDAGRYQGMNFPESDDAKGEGGEHQRPQMTNFWPAVIGWIVGIVILTSLFGALTGGGG